MDVTVYVGEAGVLVLMPSCFLPCIELEHRHGPQRHCGNAFVEESADSPLAKRVHNEFRERTYAQLSLDEGILLLGGEHPCIEQAMLHARLLGES